MPMIDGVPLDNATLGWTHRATSEPLPSYEADLSDLKRAGRDGVVPIPGTTSPVLLRIVVQTPRAGLESLIALFRQGQVWSDNGREALFEFKSMSPTGYGPSDQLVDATFVIRIPGAFFRSTTVGTFSAALTSASVALPVFPGMSAPVQDAMIRVRGAATGVQVTDASGAWLRLPDVPAGQWVRFECDTGRAFQTATDVWVGGIEVSGLVDFGGPRGLVEITPVLAAGDPSSRAGRLTIATASRSGAICDVRGKAAYLL